MSEEVRNMFSDISGKYDLLNDVLSIGRHRIWKKNFVRKINLPENGKHLDVATGTGDIATLVAKYYGENTEVIGVDFSDEMIINAQSRQDKSMNHLTFKKGDATNLDFTDEYFNSVTISFGIRNIPNLQVAIREMARVLKPNGVLAIMEFGTPTPPFSWLYSFYSKFIMPIIGKLISGNDSAYSYLPETIKRFPYGEKFKKIILSEGQFSEVIIQKIEFGTVYAYYCYKK